MATGVMTIANDALQGNAPLTTVADRINWKVIPATAVAAGIFYGFEQINEKVATGLAAVAFITAFAGFLPGYQTSGFYQGGGKTSPLGTLLSAFGQQSKLPATSGPYGTKGTQTVIGGIPYTYQ